MRALIILNNNTSGEQWVLEHSDCDRDQFGPRYLPSLNLCKGPSSTKAF